MEDLIEVTAGLEGDMSSVNTTPKGKQNFTNAIWGVRWKRHLSFYQSVHAICL